MKVLIALMLFSSIASAKVVEMKVTKKGYEPSRFEVNKGEEVTLKITRETKATCATEITMPSEDIDVDLPLGKTVEVKFTAKKKGEIAFGCHMDHMIGGVIVVN